MYLILKIHSHIFYTFRVYELFILFYSFIKVQIQNYYYQYKQRYLYVIKRKILFHFYHVILLYFKNREYHTIFGYSIFSATRYSTLNQRLFIAAHVHAGRRLKKRFIKILRETYSYYRNQVNDSLEQHRILIYLL